MVALLTSQKVRVVVLFDSEPRTQRTAKELMQDRLIRSEGVLFVGDSFDPVRGAADIEDLLDEDTYIALVKEAYTKELTGKTMQLNPKVPRMVARVEAAFEQLGLEFF